MTCYAAELTFKGAVVGDPEDEPLFEASIRLVQAESADEATAKAEALGRHSQHDYLNSANERVAWTFMEVSEVQEIEDQTLEHGTEIFSRMSGTISPSTEE